MSATANYTQFCDYVNSLVDVTNFKMNPSFNYVLEHVSYEQGMEYLSFILSKTPFQEKDIVEFCRLNDQYGNGVKNDYGFIHTSPSNLRYIFHSYLILNHINQSNQKTKKVVEVGCGYGGLCLAISYFSKIMNVTIDEYHLIDLPEISRLQNMYLEKHNIEFPTYFHNAFEYGQHISSRDLFLVSNYCFSEISKENQDLYIKHLFSKVIHGFMVWNHIPVYDFGFNMQVEDEYPLTGSLNKYIYF